MPTAKILGAVPIVLTSGQPKVVSVEIAPDTTNFSVSFTLGGSSAKLEQKTPPPPQHTFTSEKTNTPFNPVKFDYSLTATKTGAGTVHTKLFVTVTNTNGNTGHDDIQVDVK